MGCSCLAPFSLPAPITSFPSPPLSNSYLSSLPHAPHPPPLYNLFLFLPAPPTDDKGKYVYGHQLLALEACSANRTVPAYMCKVVTPLKLHAWQEALADYPNVAFTGYIQRGIESGFRIGCDTSRVTLRSKKGNLPSALEHPSVVEKYLHEEIEAGRVIKLQQSDSKDLSAQCSPFGVIPKKNRPNKWRLIVDLSSPQGHSINDGILKELSTLSYVSVDSVVAGILQQDKGTLMAKMDICRAYRNIPVHHSDRVLLGMHWNGNTYIDTTLPFGLRSAPLILSVMADALQWIMEKMGAQWVAH